MNFEVPIDFSNERVFYRPNWVPARNDLYPRLTPEVEAWLDQRFWDWGIVNWCRTETVMGEFEPHTRVIVAGKIFQFENRRQACMFKIAWD